MSPLLAVPVLLFLLLLSACGDTPDTTDYSPNLTIEGIMEDAKKITTRRATVETSSYYEAYVRTNAGDKQHVRFGIAQLTEDDLARSIGQRVTVQCYHKAPYRFCVCCAKLFVGGREITKTRK